MKLRNLKILSRLWRIQTINYFTDPINIVLGIILTSVTMVCWIAFKPTKDGFSTDPFILASAIGISIIRNSQYNFNLTVSDWKEKRFFKKIFNTPLPRTLLVFSILSFNWFINIFISALLFGLAMIFSRQRIVLSQVQWGPFIVGFVLNVIISNIMALLWNTLFKRKDVVLVVSLLSYFGPMYLLGLGIPWNVVGNYQGLNIFLYLFPHRYSLSIMQAAWIGNAGDMSFPLITNDTIGGGVDPNSWLGVHGFGYGTLGWWIPALASIGWTLLFGMIALMILNYRYNYGLRKYKDYNGVQIHLRYISEIKKTTSVEELNDLISYINANNNYEIHQINLHKKPEKSKNKNSSKEQS
ncbi:hypothetical protein LD125_00229 [Mesoplasma sp. JKS002658]|uniref:hypothetical protein n=1 Tax=Mesoplasma whartonense TaxID=2878854 RepID=UPI002022A75E|nr:MULTISPECIES: hypothetical protein [unclassified Mesoplasma]MCL8211260.1 hypothetical protein [Mesoplasma sp. JKS002664]MCL8211921.1 hypothetical protein [Mesoplasma sp. JKS002662]MCL8212846.1 hypothetical protein [Mesoplasma sp. JKS002661]MCL8213095.1 hypothetical protein [Mesoplasma sp. JKS002660]MCL8213974.1 hypothetical protein [Mesoplasma sp. JKS002658]